MSHKGLLVVRIDQISGHNFPVKSGLTMRKAVRMLRVHEENHTNKLDDLFVLKRGEFPLMSTKPNAL
jgi:hypothetical protein